MYNEFYERLRERQEFMNRLQQSQFLAQPGPYNYDPGQVNAFSQVMRDRSLLHGYVQDQANRDTMFGGMARLFGYGAQSNYMSNFDQRRLYSEYVANQESAQRYLQLTPSAMLGGNFARSIGLGRIYDETLGMADFKRRNEVDVSRRMNSLTRRLMSRGDLNQDSTLTLRNQMNMAERLSNIDFKGISEVERSRLKEAGYVSDTNFLGFIPNPFAGEEGRYTLDERRQIMERAARSGQFMGLAGKRRYNPATGEFEIEGSATTASARKRQQLERGSRAALAGQRIASNLSEVSEQMGIQDTEQAMGFLEKLAGDRKIQDLDSQDIRRLKDLKEQLSLTNEAVEAALELGEDISKTFGLESGQGRRLVTETLRDVSNARSLGAISDDATKLSGGEDGVSNRFIQATARASSSRTGRRIQAVDAYLNMAEAQGADPTEVKALKDEKEDMLAGTGRINALMVSKARELAGFKRTALGSIDTAVDMDQGTIQRYSSSGSSGAKQALMSQVNKAKKRFGGDIPKTVDYLMNEVSQGDLRESFQQLGPTLTRDLVQNQGTFDVLGKLDTPEFKISKISRTIARMNKEKVLGKERRRGLLDLLGKNNVEGLSLEDLQDVDITNMSVKDIEEQLIKARDPGTPGIFDKMSQYLLSGKKRVSRASMEERVISSLPEGQREAARSALSRGDTSNKFTSDLIKRVDILIDEERKSRKSNHDLSTSLAGILHHMQLVLNKVVS